MKRSLILIAAIISSISYGQGTLTLNGAVEAALKNNYNIQILGNNAQIAGNNNTIGNAGMLPQVGVNAQGSYSNTNINQRFTNGTEIVKNGVVSTNYGAGVNLNYILFSGLRAQYAYKRLGEEDAISELQLKAGINTTVANVMSAYFNVLREQQTLRSLQENITIYEEREKIAKKRYDIGSAAKTDWLQAQIDLNEQKSLIIKQRANIQIAKNNLDQLLGREAGNDYTVEEISPALDTLNYDSLKNTVYQSNIDMQVLQRNINIAKYTISETRAQQYPTLALNSTYNFGKTNSQAGFTLFNQALGFNGGLTLSWNAFNGLNTRRQIANVKLSYNNTELQLKDYKNSVNAGFVSAWTGYNTTRQQYELEKSNNALAQENVNIMLERFRLGNCTTIDLKLAQQTLQDTQNRLILAGYELKLSETELLRLAGGLVK